MAFFACLSLKSFINQQRPHVGLIMLVMCGAHVSVLKRNIFHVYFVFYFILHVHNCNRDFLRNGCE